MFYTTNRSVVVDWCLKESLGWWDPGQFALWRAKGDAGKAKATRFVDAHRGGDALRCPGCETESLRVGSIDDLLVWSCERCGGILHHFRPGESAVRGLWEGFSWIARLLRLSG
jgi:hypothetical protein